MRPLSFHVDLAVVGPMTRSAADLSLATTLLAGPDEVQAVAYKLALPPSRAEALKDFRVLVLDSHPLLPTSEAVRAELDRIARGLEKEGARLVRRSEALPNLVLMAQTYMTLLNSVFGADIPEDVYKAAQGAIAGIPPSVDSLDAMRGRGLVASHRDWIKADRIRSALAANWRELFRMVDVALCPVAPTPAFPHDHSPDQSTRVLDVDGKSVPYQDQLVWPGIATLTGLPATVMPIGRAPNGLPIGMQIGMQIVGPYLEDRTPLRFAELVEAAFGGFTPPPGFT